MSATDLLKSLTVDVSARDSVATHKLKEDVAKTTSALGLNLSSFSNFFLKDQVISEQNPVVHDSPQEPAPQYSSASSEMTSTQTPAPEENKDSLAPEESTASEPETHAPEEDSEQARSSSTPAQEPSQEKTEQSTAPATSPTPQKTESAPVQKESVTEEKTPATAPTQATPPAQQKESLSSIPPIPDPIYVPARVQKSSSVPHVSRETSKKKAETTEDSSQLKVPVIEHWKINIYPSLEGGEIEETIKVTLTHSAVFEPETASVREDSLPSWDDCVRLVLEKAHEELSYYGKRYRIEATRGTKVIKYRIFKPAQSSSVSFDQDGAVQEKTSVPTSTTFDRSSVDFLLNEGSQDSLAELSMRFVMRFSALANQARAENNLPYINFAPSQDAGNLKAISAQFRSAPTVEDIASYLFQQALTLQTPPQWLVSPNVGTVQVTVEIINKSTNSGVYIYRIFSNVLSS